MKKYDRTIKMYDEGFAPCDAEKVLPADAFKLNFLSETHAESYLFQMMILHLVGEGKLDPGSVAGLPINKRSILEIGPGDGYAARNLRYAGYIYDTIDISDVTEPIIKTSILDLDPSPLKNKYHTVCAFQVLEHVPYDNFKECLTKIRFIAEKYVVVSLPYSCQGYTEIRKEWCGQNNCVKIRHDERYEPTNIPVHKYRPEYIEEFPWVPHYWEIGNEGYPLDKVLADIQSTGLEIVRGVHGPNPFHFFIVMRVGDKEENNGL